ncbi:trypsin inhibitor-like isoform X3 [Diabrotica virgifera virgifera]|uniref:BPTI/Kunitz inhibitor domain-containing protein n=1 Tax=Diabrotica virgifera virgifera TaxID=50390 RepID=A0ABM5KDY1_DIAVI|nr:trypsin inhibitor-like isoform X3 [Diabrotica virgifera virgifera]
MKLLLALLSLAVLTARAHHIHASLRDDIFTESDCTAPVHSGPRVCLAHFPVWRYDIYSRFCVPDIYGGCRATKNNFDSREECEAVTKAVCPFYY